MDLVSRRTELLDKEMQNYNTSDTNKFYAQEKFKIPLDAFIDDLRLIIDKNSDLENKFKEIQKDVMKVGNIVSFLDGLSEIETMVYLLAN